MSVSYKRNKNPALQKTNAAAATRMPGLKQLQRGEYASPALQFVTTVTHVLSLDKNNVVGVHNLRRDLLKLIGVDEFSSAAVFRDPAPSFVLQDVICDFCAHPTNMDLLRDPHVINHSWECAHCAHRYNKLAIEATLVDKAYQLSYAYQAQDLVCQKCKLVKAENLSDICPQCSGSFVCRMSAEELGKKLQTMSLIASFHSFPWLEGVVKKLLL